MMQSNSEQTQKAKPVVMLFRRKDAMLAGEGRIGRRSGANGI